MRLRRRCAGLRSGRHLRARHRLRRHRSRRRSRRRLRTAVPACSSRCRQRRRLRRHVRRRLLRHVSRRSVRRRLWHRVRLRRRRHLRHRRARRLRGWRHLRLRLRLRRRHRLSRRGTARSRSPSPSQPRLPRACARVHATLHHDVSTSAAVRRGRGRAGRGFDRGSARRRMSPPCARRLVALDLPASAAEVKPSSFARSSGRPANAATRRPVSTRQHRAVAHGNRSALGAHVARGGQASQAAEGSHT